MTTEVTLTNGDTVPEVAMDTEEQPQEQQPLLSDGSVRNALKISRQFMILLEEYRYLMTCYQETCGCHVKFDHQLFFHKIEEKYNILSNISASNALLADALDDNSDYVTLNDLWVDIKKDSASLKRDCSDIEPQFIKRIKVVGRNATTANQLLNGITGNSSSSINGNANNNENSNAGANEGSYNSETNGGGGEQSELLKTEMIAYRCNHPKCDFLTFNQDDVVKHFNNHGVYDPAKKVEKDSVVYVCEQCSKEFSAQKWLDNHIENVHANVKIYSCDQPKCNYKTKFRCVMDDHKKRHSATREFKCTWGEGCVAEFVTKRDMLAHINFSHKGIKNYACTWENCTASFKDSNRLRHHLFTHTGERPYSCDFPGCQASFKQMPHLHKHRKTHANDTHSRSAGLTHNNDGSNECSSSAEDNLNTN